MIANPPTSQIFQKTKKTTGSNKLPKYSWIFYFKNLLSSCGSLVWLHHKIGKKEKRKEKP
jgi:hypothetical protein